MRKIVAVQLLIPIIPSLLFDITHSGIPRPWHMPAVELDLLGVERSKFRVDYYVSTRFCHAAGVEALARKLGLVTTIGLN